MIAQYAHKEYLLSQAEAVERGIASDAAGGRRGGAPTALDDFSAEELTQLSAELAREIASERNADASSSDDEPAKDAYVFVPRQPILSLVQSSLEEYFETQQPEALVTARAGDDGRRGGAGAEPVFSDRSLRDVELPTDGSGRRLWGKFEVAHPKILSDPGWVWSAVAMGWRALHGRVAFNFDPPTRIGIADDARLLIVGDWGSGIPRAKNVATQMRQVLDEGKAARKQQVVIHLGDVYYSGTKWEYKHRFLPLWPVHKDEADEIMSFTLNGNHDMYAGGHAYFGTGLADARFARQGACSFFELGNSHWQILALDTAYEDAGLYGGQANWITGKRGEAPGRKTMLLSHHQLFSAYEPGAQELRAKLKPVLDAAPVDAWFWGHEHRCLVYDSHDQVGFASCVGHGGIPEYLVAREGDPYTPPLVYDYRKIYGGGQAPWDTFGFAVVDLEGDTGTVRYIDEDGIEHHRTVLP